MPASAKTLEYIEKLNSLGPLDITLLDSISARTEDNRITLPFLGEPEPVKKIENRIIQEDSVDVPIRIYWPKNTDQQHLNPIIIFFHGGGWVLGGLDSNDELCSMLANRSESVVISVDYRLAPEYKFPAALHDCYFATKWASENIGFLKAKKDTLVVAGESAGGNLATTVCLMAKEKGGPRIASQILIYPVTDLTADMSRYSKDKFGPSKQSMEWFGQQYINDESERRNPLISPCYADLHGLPPAIVITAELDPLRDQDLQFVKKLNMSGVNTTLLDYPGSIHGFMQLTSYFPEAHSAIEKVAFFVRKVYDENTV